MKEREFIDRLLALTKQAGVTLSGHQAGLCHQHVQLMLEWNRRLNLTRIVDPEQILIRHVLDSLLPAAWLPHSGFALDVGTGPGFPGLPLKILHPALNMILLETLRKKVSFLKTVLSALALEDVWALQGRWEDLANSKQAPARQHYALITMRAVRLQAGLLVDLAQRLLQPGGVFAWWAGPGADADRDLHAVKLRGSTIFFAGRFSYRLPTLSQPRQLFVWKREG